MKKTITLFLALVGGLLLKAQTPEPKVLFIGIDGLRSDAFQQANTPVMDSLRNVGLYTWDSWHLGITVSGPSWSTMLCGVWEPKHGVTGNSYSGANYNQYPYFTTRAKECRPDLKCVQLITWPNMDDIGNGGYVFNASWDQSIDVGDWGQGLVTAAAKTQLLDPDLDVLFLHYDECDGTGHGSGFTSLNPAYMNVIESRDAEIGEVMNALRARPTYANEDWLVLMTTDHGGIGLGHGGNTNVERRIWWIGAGPSIPHLQITGPDPGSYQIAGVDTALMRTSPVLADIAVTALAHLLKYTTCDPETNTTWNLDGKSWLSEATYVEDNDLDAVQVGIYPNPSQGQFTAKVMVLAEVASWELVDATGKILLNGNFTGSLGSEGRASIDTRTVVPGVYFLNILNGESKAARKVILQH